MLRFVPKLRLAMIASTKNKGLSAGSPSNSGSTRTGISPPCQAASQPIGASIRLAGTPSTCHRPSDTAVPKHTGQRTMRGSATSVITTRNPAFASTHPTPEACSPAPRTKTTGPFMTSLFFIRFPPYYFEPAKYYIPPAYPHLEKNRPPLDTSAIVRDNGIRLPYPPALPADLKVQEHISCEKTPVIPPYRRQSAPENPEDSAALAAGSLQALAT